MKLILNDVNIVIFIKIINRVGMHSNFSRIGR